MPFSFYFPLLDAIMSPLWLVREIAEEYPLITILIVALLVFAVVMIIRSIKKKRRDRK